MNPTKRLLTLALTALLTVGVSANPITLEQARQRAEQFLQKKKGSKKLTHVKTHPLTPPCEGGEQNESDWQNSLQQSKVTTPLPSREGQGGGSAVGGSAGSPLYYVFDRGTDEGYIIVSGDDQTYPVLGYTDHGNFDYSALPPNMVYWLEGYENELAALRQAQEAGTAHPRAAAPLGEDLSAATSPDAPRVGDVPTHDPIPYLCTSTWNQGDPYNQSCPMYFNLGRSVTGCVATAMAQILYYHRDKSVNETQAAMPAYEAWAEKPYNGQYLQVEGIPAESPIDWDNMLDSYGASATAKQKKAVADLMHYCGVSVKMGYTNSSSGAQSYEVANALPKYFGYGSSVRYVTFDNGYNETTWDNLIYNELKNARPVYLSGANSEGGHAFVCDGYDGDRCYHINWGWGGMSDGYYMLSKLTPGSQGIGGSSSGYNQYRDAIVGIEPEFFAGKAITFADATVRRLAVAAWDTDGDGKLTFGEAAAVTELGDIFKGQAIKTCAELYHFTALKTISADAFAGCTKLTTVKLPKSLTTIGDRAFQGCTVLKTFAIPNGVTSIGDDAFADCPALTALELPSGFSAIGARAFQNCTALTAMTLPFSLTTLGDGAFDGCTKLSTVDVATTMPADIQLGAGVFAGLNLSAATLKVRQGTRAFFTTADQWKDFGRIQEQRDLSRSTFASLEADKTFYLYNVGTGLYLTRGEAWGTQAVVGDEPMRFDLKHLANMADNVYALYSDDTGKSSHYTFRTTTDGTVGTGVAAAFVDGNLNSSAHWQFAEVKPGVYTIQIPQNVNDFKSAEQFWGVQFDHESNAASPTYGVYSDIAYADYPLNCQWRLVAYDADFATLYRASQSLLNLIHQANKEKIITQREQAVYDNMESTLEEIQAAQTRLRRRLGIVNFADATVRNAALDNWDLDGDGEITEAEAAGVTDLGTVFSGSTVQDLTDMQYFTGVTRLVNNAFQNCKQLKQAVLPPNLQTIGYRVFKNCTALESAEIGEHVQTIGVSAFEGCTALKTVRVYASDPSVIRVPASAFKSVDLAAATLLVPFGSRDAYAEADVWQAFGTIREMRTHAMPAFSPVAVNTPGYILNLGTGRYIAPGEAYGTQAVVAPQGIVYQFKRSTSMAAGTYYLSSDQTGKTNKILFRTSTDTTVGEDVKACFVDGTLSSKAYWKLEQAEDNTFTLQVPAKDATYVEDEYLGVDPSHDSDYASPTYGLYWDITADDNDRSCRWAFITEEDFNKAKAMNDAGDRLALLLAKAAVKAVDATAEQAVYDDAAASMDDIAAAVTSLQHKLQLIAFQSEQAQELCVALWDMDDDEELSYDEAAAVTDLGENFRGKSAIQSLEELRYFTGLTAIPANAFRACSAMQSIYVPAGVQAIGANAFTSTSKLKYMAVLTPDKVDASNAGLPRSLTVFVPEAQTEAYAADETWGTHTIATYTGVPTVQADDQERAYGRTNSKLTFTVTGAPINGEPVLSCEADATTPVGTTPIVVQAGTITSEGLYCQHGVLTVLPADITVTAKSCSRYQGQPNPDFEVTYSSFKNREKAEDVILTQPSFECDATPESPVGEYEIRVFGAEAQNYVFTYVPGVLTVLPADDAVRDLKTSALNSSTLYDLSGRRIPGTSVPAAKGVYVRGGKKVVK